MSPSRKFQNEKSGNFSQFQNASTRNLKDDTRDLKDDEFSEKKTNISLQKLKNQSFTSSSLISTFIIANSVIVTTHGKSKYYDPRSLYIFKANNCFRYAIIWLTEWKIYDYFILIVILLNSISLALYDYSDRGSATLRNQILDIIGNVFTVIFALEAILKIISLGFVIHKKSYLRDGWNFIDFSVVVSGLLEFLPQKSINLKSLRVLRVLRPLRSINAIPIMRRQVGSLIQALPDFANVGVFLLFVFMLFAILGLYQYNGLFYNRCAYLSPIYQNSSYYYVLNVSDSRVCTSDQSGVYTCPGQQSCQSMQNISQINAKQLIFNDPQVYYGITNFDNIGTSLLTVFIIITMDGWNQIMYNLIDGEIPVIAAIFCSFLIVLGSFFMLNLILAVIIQAFIEFQKKQLQQDLYNLEFHSQEGPQEQQSQKDDQQIKSEATEREEDKNQIIDSIHNQSPSVLKLEQQQEINKEWDSLKEQNSNLYNQIQSTTLKLEEITSKHKNPDLSFLKPVTIKQRVLKAFKEGKDNTFFESKKSLFDFRENEVNLQVDKLDQLNNPKEEKTKDVTNIDKNNLFVKKSIVSYKESINNITTIRQFNSIKKDIAKMKVHRQNANLQKELVVFKMEGRAESNIVFNFCYKLQKSSLFQAFISSIIVCNTIILAMDKYPSNPSLSYILNFVNIGFTFVFLIEMIIKLLGLSIKGYFQEKFNIFDFIIVLLSFLDLGLTYGLQSQLGKGSALTALRGFRLLRIFKLAKHWKQFQLVLKTIKRSLVEVSNFSVLLFLFMYVYTLMGLELFAHKAKFNSQGNIDNVNGTEPQINFDDFFNSIITVFILLTNDGWSTIYYNYYRAAGAAVSSLYFISLIIIGQKILLNLFLAILLQKFDDASFRQEGKQQGENEENQENNQNEENFKSSSKQIKKQKKASLLAKMITNIKKIFSSTQKKIEPEIDKIDQLNERRKRKKLLDLQKSTEQSIYEKNDEILLDGTSLNMFSSKNKVRLMIFKLVVNLKFEIFIILIIIASSVQLALENPLNDPNGVLAQAIFQIDVVTSAIFTLESILKIIAFGLLFNGSKSYLKSYWNIIDFIIVIFSLAAFSNQRSLKIFKMFRVLRPLRVISRNQGLKTAVIALLMAIPHIFSIISIVLLFFIIFGIIGISYFKGKYYYCNSSSLTFDFSSITINHKWDCLNSGSEWLNNPSNFDNIFQACATLFQLATTSGWSDIMYNSIAATEIDYVQIPGDKPYWSLFFILFIVVGSFFLLNLFVGIVIIRFQSQRNEITGISFLKPEQQEWVDIKVQYLKSKPIKVSKPPENKFRRFFFDFQSKPAFDNFILVCIILNTLLMPIKWYNEPPLIQSVIEDINYAFTGIFILECIIKILALGGNYFKEGWNIFDLLIVTGSMGSIFISSKTNINLGGTTSIIRIFRIGRMLRLIKRAKSLKVVFNTFIVTLPAMANVGGLLLLVIYLYSILGVFLFSTVTINGILTDTLNFQTFSKAFLTLFVVATGDGWNNIMQSYALINSIQQSCIQNPSYSDYVSNGYKTVGCGSPGIAQAFFYSFYLFVNLIFINLFIAIILDGFQETQLKEQRDANGDTLNNFRIVWSQFDPDATSFIKISQLKEFLFKLGPPMGFDKTLQSSKFLQDKFIASLDLPVYNNFQDYMFMDVLESLAYKVTVQQLASEKRNEPKDSICSEDEEQDNEEEKKEKIEKQIKNEINQIEFGNDKKNIEALQEMNKVDKRVNQFKSKLQRDNHFSSLHQAAAEVVFNQLKYLVNKNKLVKELNDLKTSSKLELKMSNSIEQDKQKKSDQSKLSKHSQQKKKTEEKFSSIDVEDEDFYLDKNQIVFKQISKRYDKKRAQSKTEQKYSINNGSNLEKSKDIDNIIKEEESYYQRQKSKASLKFDSQVSFLRNQNQSNLLKTYNDNAINLNSLELKEIKKPQIELQLNKKPSKLRKSDLTQEEKYKYKMNRPPPIHSEQKNMKIKKDFLSQFKAIGGSIGGTGEENQDFNIEELKKEVEELLFSENSPVKLSPVKLEKLSRQESSHLNLIIEKQISKILNHKQTKLYLDQINKGEEVNLKELEKQVFKQDSINTDKSLEEDEEEKKQKE